MTHLRQRMIEDMQVRNLSPHTQRAYLQSVAQFAQYFGRSPARLGREEIRSYQLYLTNERKLAPTSIRIAVCALRFLYKVTLARSWTLEDALPHPKTSASLPAVLSPEEVRHFLGCARSLKHRALLSTCYAAGLRVSEVVSLKVTAIDSQRMVIHVEQGKGLRDRYVMLSPKLLELLRRYWQARRPKVWLFPGRFSKGPMTTQAVVGACKQAREQSGLSKPVSPHALRHAFAVHLLEAGSDIRTIQLLLGHRNLATTTRYLQIATTKVCATTSPLDLLPPATASGPPTGS